MEEDLDLPIRTASLYKELASAASAMNAATDEFTKVVSPLDTALQNLNLGLECWVRVQSYGDPRDGSEIFHEIGYARVGSKWGIALRTVEDDGSGDPSFNREERWLFNDGPRSRRISAIAKVPNLLEELRKKADAATKKIKGATYEARSVVTAVTLAAQELKPRETKKSGGTR